MKTLRSPIGGRLNKQRYLLYSVVTSVANNLQSIVNALKANNVDGNNSILIGNNGIVHGNNLWAVSCEQKEGGNQLLVMGTFRINLNRLYGLLTNPSRVISCLNPNQTKDYFALFGVNGAVPANLVSQVSQIKLLI